MSEHCMACDSAKRRMGRHERPNPGKLVQTAHQHNSCSSVAIQNTAFSAKTCPICAQLLRTDRAQMPQRLRARQAILPACRSAGLDRQVARRLKGARRVPSSLKYERAQSLGSS